MARREDERISGKVLDGPCWWSSMKTVKEMPEKEEVEIGRVVLINAVILAIPIFCSSHSLIPLSILKTVYKLCRDFLWNKKDGIKGLHYVAWVDLCKPVEKGGLGIHSAVRSREVMRAKFAWNLHTHPNSMLNKSLSASYGGDVLHAVPKRNYSSSWKILMSGANALCPIVRWKVGTGNVINILEDIWVLDRSFSKWPTFIAVVEGEFPALHFFIIDRR
ncbi:hypothetical protein M5K25_008423 [Dendrobium thyrsiflorum]|uniref:Uncharacterized protein n=1 Tax=Dendrobium thyrsiflorum TaxID=117978 RepID=A0ABD0V8M4_DENTH